MLLKSILEATADCRPTPFCHSSIASFVHHHFYTEALSYKLRPPPNPNQAFKRALPAKNEGMDRTYKGGIKAYWKRRGYYRVDAAAAQRRPPLPTAELGGGVAKPPQEDGSSARRRRRRGWRVRRGGQLGRRLLRALSPRRWLVRLRDAYVSAMLRLASSPAVGYGAGAPYCATTPHGAAAYARATTQLKEYDEKVLVEIYRSILARGGPLPVAVPGDGAGAPAAVTLRLPTAV
ncbi:unnamed protein product [Urochloa humidicola]